MRGSRILTLIFFVIVVFMIVYSLRYSAEARFGPLVLGIPAAVLAVIQLVRESLMFSKRTTSSTGSGSVSERKRSYLPYLEITACLVGMTAAIYVFGLALGLALFIIAYLKLHREGWLLTIALGLGVPALTYGIFEAGLHMLLYRGILFH